MSRWDFASFKRGDLVCWRTTGLHTSDDISTGVIYEFYNSNVYEKASYDIYLPDGTIVNLESRGLMSIEKYQSLLKSD